jgi:hypothetical protein
MRFASVEVPLSEPSQDAPAKPRWTARDSYLA